MFFFRFPSSNNYKFGRNSSERKLQVKIYLRTFHKSLMKRTVEGNAKMADLWSNIPKLMNDESTSDHDSCGRRQHLCP